MTQLCILIAARSEQELPQERAKEQRAWISSTRAVMGVPVMTQAWRRQSALVMRAAALLLAATSCASSSMTRQKPNRSSAARSACASSRRSASYDMNTCAWHGD
jgi:hypothetical protein